MDLNILKNQKGITGIDIVIAITIIMTSTIAILAIYVNVVGGSKKATRNSAATRIATGILENIDAMYYADVEQELDRIKKEKNIVNEDDPYSFSFIANLSNETVFNTKIQSGYKVELDSTEITSSTDKGFSEDDGAIWDCPLVLQVKVTVSYEASGTTQKVILKTIKQKEILEECNAPVLTDLLGTKYKSSDGTTKKIKSLKEIQPLKWSSTADAYVKTSEGDEWYNYGRREWAKVVITTDSSLFDSSNGSISLDNLNNCATFLWIPRFGKSTKDYKIAFAYGSTNNRISLITTYANKADGYGGSSKAHRVFEYYGIKTYKNRNRDSDSYTCEMANEEILNVNSNMFPDGVTGLWLNITKGTPSGETNLGKINYSDYSIIWDSDFAPIITHYGMNYY